MGINSDIVTGVKLFLECGDRTFLSKLSHMDRSDINGQAVVRYLMQLKHWPFTPDSEFANVMEHLFADFPERKNIPSKEYQETTKSLILDAFDYECIEIIPEVVVREEPVEKPVKSRKPKKYEPKPEEHEQFPDKSDIDTNGASERLKRVIAIQRG